ncbi:glycoside hydrolase family 16 protein [Sporormia fimetaria CBS 119925]|uniref:chitinase n=1 Tax=Sporormia fimetaria CBS 119925 TaxID=1340428 RepID=A0A6A6V148_9PLEO|nr:glycoside hydrolase family 16 protein [Sporormia fimetaria CBS 119925]
MMLSFAVPALALLSLLPTSLAQTFSECDPTKKQGCPNLPALGGNATFHFNDTLYDKLWLQPKKQGKVDWSEKGATFTVARQLDSPQLDSNFYMLFGRMTVVMKAARGRGIISSAILQSETRDEIDWEFKGDNATAMTNYYGKGNEKFQGRGKDFDIPAPQDDFHNYTIDWTKERIQWWFDGEMLREVTYAEANGGADYPQSPMNLRIGAWAAGDPDNNQPGVVEWAGGEVDWSDAPYVMTVQEVFAHDYTSAKEYSWENMDASGTWDKVKIIEGQSAAMEEYLKPSGVRNRWAALGKTAQIAIICSAVGAVIIIALVVLFCCIKQRRAGRRAAAAYEAQQNKEAAELHQFLGQPVGNGRMGYNRI